MRFVCANCGNPVHLWYYGWKHARGWRSPPSCGKPPVPVAAAPLPSDNEGPNDSRKDAP